jgi:hypothetical protein
MASTEGTSKLAWLETRVGAPDEAEHMMVTRFRVQEGDQATGDAVADPQPEHFGVEIRHLLRLGREHQRVTQPPGHHVLDRLLPLRHTDPLVVAAHVCQHGLHLARHA